MCFFKASSDSKIAKAQRADEVARQGWITSGIAGIDSAFSGFNDDFYNKRAKDYVDYATPGLEKKTKAAHDNLIYALSRTGNLDSSAAIKRNTDLTKEADAARIGIANTGLNSANALRSNVEGTRGNVVAELNATGDSGAAAQSALRNAQNLIRLRALPRSATCSRRSPAPCRASGRTPATAILVSPGASPCSAPALPRNAWWDNGMCIPAALALFGAAGMKYAGEKQAADARRDTFRAEQARQNAFTAQQTERFQDSLDHVGQLTNPDAIAKAAGAREGTLSAAIAPQPQAASYLPGSSSAPSVVATAAETARAGSAATSASLAHTLAALGGTTDQMQSADIAIGRNSGQIGSFKAGSADVLAAEMRAASRKGAFLRGAGEIAERIGMAALDGGIGRASSRVAASGTLGSDLGLEGTQSLSHVSPGII